jgi:hypothetical protein
VTQPEGARPADLVITATGTVTPTPNPPDEGTDTPQEQK